MSIAVSMLVVFVLPRHIGLEAYGYFQLYVFYASYVGLFHLGWVDGLFLRYGGSTYQDLDKALLGSQFRLFGLLQFLLAGVFAAASIAFLEDSAKVTVFILLAACVVLANPRSAFSYILQCTGRYRDSARILMIERIVYLALVLAAVSSGVTGFVPVLVADLIGRLVGLAYAAFACREIVFSRVRSARRAVVAAVGNARIGLHLTVSNLAGMFATGAVRFGIEQYWGIVVFGAVSLSLSVSNLVMQFVGAVGNVVYPAMRRSSADQLPANYSALRDLVAFSATFALTLYWPLRTILAAWLPQYGEALNYLALTLPVLVFESRLALVLNPALFALRCEVFVLRTNLIALGVGVSLTLLFTSAVPNLSGAVASIALTSAVRCVIAELAVARNLKVKSGRGLSALVIVTAAQATSGWAFEGPLVFAIDVGLFFAYVAFERKAFRRAFGRVVQSLA